ncbi:MAG: tRNA dihydrouridine(20/20a) synthase DusA [Gammaproteobacteria bacterium]
MPNPHLFCVAPMMDCTDRHDRYLLRLISRRTLLYTEMITTGALIHGDTARLLAFDTSEHPLAPQIGGSEPRSMAACARLAQDHGFDEVNINVGCPSERVRSGSFGACLMAEPELVAECVAAMRSACALPVTVKTRIGIDDRDSYEALAHFIATVAAAGCNTFAIHARKAWLKGLSPKQNRELPPLRYDVAYRVKRDFPNLRIIVNGGIQSLSDARRHLRRLDGVMIGRAAYRDPYMLASVDQSIFGDAAPPLPREEVAKRMVEYTRRMCAQGLRPGAITRHMVGLFQGEPGARQWRRTLSEQAHRPGASAAVILAALEARADAAARAAQFRGSAGGPDVSSSQDAA